MLCRWNMMIMKYTHVMKYTIEKKTVSVEERKYRFNS